MSASSSAARSPGLRRPGQARLLRCRARHGGRSRADRSPARGALPLCAAAEPAGVRRLGVLDTQGEGDLLLRWPRPAGLHDLSRADVPAARSDHRRGGVFRDGRRGRRHVAPAVLVSRRRCGRRDRGLPLPVSAGMAALAAVRARPRRAARCGGTAGPSGGHAGRLPVRRRHASARALVPRRAWVASRRRCRAVRRRRADEARRAPLRRVGARDRVRCLARTAERRLATPACGRGLGRRGGLAVAALVPQPWDRRRGAHRCRRGRLGRSHRGRAAALVRRVLRHDSVVRRSDRGADRSRGGPRAGRPARGRVPRGRARGRLPRRRLGDVFLSGCPDHCRRGAEPDRAVHRRDRAARRREHATGACVGLAKRRRRSTDDAGGRTAGRRDDRRRAPRRVSGGSARRRGCALPVRQGLRPSRRAGRVRRPRPRVRPQGHAGRRRSSCSGKSSMSATSMRRCRRTVACAGRSSTRGSSRTSRVRARPRRRGAPASTPGSRSSRRADPTMPRHGGDRPRPSARRRGARALPRGTLLRDGLLGDVREAPVGGGRDAVVLRRRDRALPARVPRLPRRAVRRADRARGGDRPRASSSRSCSST